MLQRILRGDPVGTHIPATTDRLQSRKRWLLAEIPRGTLHIDAGAAHVLRTGGASLLPVGVTRVDRTSAAATCSRPSTPTATASPAASPATAAPSCAASAAAHSDEISAILGYSYGDAVIHRNNLVLSG